MEQHKNLIIKGARTHNLKNIDITLPRDKMIVVSGVSGSGKSSLAFDTIYAEGQRRYVESLSPYARQFLGLMEKPDLDYIEGLSPAISIEQKTTHRNPRSTVATVTEVHDYLRLLFARTGIPYCYKCGKPISAQSVDQIVDLVLAKAEGTKIMILAPVARGRKGEFQKVFEDARKSGYVRVSVDGELHTLDEEIKLDKQKKHTIEIVVDRLIVRDGIRQRCSESIESALKMANGLVTVDSDGNKEIFSEHFACPDCGISYPEIQPRLFSFNNPQGACEACHGLGEIIEYDLNKIIPDRSLSISQGAIQTHQQKHKIAYAELESLSRHFNFDLDVPFEQLPENIQDIIINGTDEEIEFYYESKVKKGKYKGLFDELKRRYREAMWGGVKEWLESFMTEQKCHSCHGKRLNKIALSVKVADKNIDDVVCYSVKESYDFFENLKLSDNGQKIAVQILKEIRSRLRFLKDVGLEYLTLDRKSATLSGGEAQRIRLATQIGSKLVGVLYVLDEPTIGLHQRDNDRLLQTLLELRDIGNTLVIVEHDEQVIRSADYVVDLGPRAGEHGGMIIAEGTPGEIEKNPSSITGRFLSGADSIDIPQKRREGNGQFLTITGAKLHNLKNITVSIPLGKMSIITGVSGSGKSTLVNEIIYPALFNHLFHKTEENKYYKSIDGIENIDKVICIDQSPIGRTPRSNPATYIGLFNH
ncbi:MAG: excinuclease ABC subunit UvrA, partial [Spirochaetales bacterium]|nr:excinuclease ABC subunit UvrA [Spirochaetales bacterium]